MSKIFEFFTPGFSRIIGAENMAAAVELITDQWPEVEVLAIQAADLPGLSYPEDVFEKAFDLWLKEAKENPDGFDLNYTESTGKKQLEALKNYITRIVINDE